MGSALDNRIRRPPSPSWPWMTLSAIGIKHNKDEGIGGTQRWPCRSAIFEPVVSRVNGRPSRLSGSIDVIRYITASFGWRTVATDSLGGRARINSIRTALKIQFPDTQLGAKQSWPVRRTRDVVKSSRKLDQMTIALSLRKSYLLVSFCHLVRRGRLLLSCPVLCFIVMTIEG